MKKLVIATGNPGKLKELQELLNGLQIEVISQKSLGISDSGLPALADDSGLCVDVLGGAPGIYSARYAGPGADDAANNAQLLQTLLPFRRSGIPLTARFVCVLVLVRHADDPLPLFCQGLWEGEILPAPQGGHGFGYDPLFLVREKHCSSAELDRSLKNRISHRAQAMNQLLHQLRNTLSAL